MRQQACKPRKYVPTLTHRLETDCRVTQLRQLCNNPESASCDVVVHCVKRARAAAFNVRTQLASFGQASLSDAQEPAS